MKECAILLNNIILQDHIHDFWRWSIDHGYSVRGTYRFLTSAVEGVIESDINKVWHRLVSKKISLFGWCLLQDRIPTKSNLVRRHILQVNDNLCVGGCGVVETTDHLFIVCDLFGKVWFLVCQWLGISFVFPGAIKDHYFQFIHVAGMPQAVHSYLKIIWRACIWAIWKDRNNCIFKNEIINPHGILETVKMKSFLWLSLHFLPIAFDFHDWWKQPLCCMGVM